jgi:HSP20 family protein
MAHVPIKREDKSLSPEVRRRESSFPSPWPLAAPEPLDGNPFSLMRHLTDEMDRMVSGFWSGQGNDGHSLWWPPMEVTEDKGTLTVTVDLPGLKPDDVKVEVMEGSLIVSGERKEEREVRDRTFRRSERRYGRFRRAVALPDGADTTKARAAFSNGELKVSIPVKETAPATREIPIESSGEKPGKH